MGVFSFGRGSKSETRQGRAALLDSKLNRGAAFTEDERRVLNLQGLLPAAVESLDHQVKRELEQVRRKATPIDRYEYLSGLLDRNVQLYVLLVGALACVGALSYPILLCSFLLVSQLLSASGGQRDRDHAIRIHTDGRPGVPRVRHAVEHAPRPLRHDQGQGSRCAGDRQLARARRQSYRLHGRRAHPRSGRKFGAGAAGC
jgi:hypothetical protein